jgi:hypothetical protein
MFDFWYFAAKISVFKIAFAATGIASAKRKARRLADAGLRASLASLFSYKQKKLKKKPLDSFFKRHIL